MTIGERIKVLRKKNDLTQEKLADYLCVSCQAVSKWECGLACPDLSLIAPLTRLFHVTSDELLGLNEEQYDKRKAALEEAYDKTWKTGDMEKRGQIIEMAVSEYPGELRYLYWLGTQEQMVGCACRSDEEHNAHMEKAVRCLSRVIEDTGDEALKADAIFEIVLSLRALGRRDEGMRYAKLYPEGPSISKEEVIGYCLSGEEERRHGQKQRFDALMQLAHSVMYYDSHERNHMARELVKAAFPDGNYLAFLCVFFLSHIYDANLMVREGKPEEAIQEIRTAHSYQLAYRELVFGQFGVYRYTSPLFDLLTEDTTEMREMTDAWFDRENFHFWLNSVSCDPIRNRPDFQELYNLA